MGRGRQKAKQTKVARELKYYSQETNFSALEQELRGGSRTEGHSEDSDEYAEYVDRYAAWVDDDFDDEDGDDPVSRQAPTETLLSA